MKLSSYIVVAQSTLSAVFHCSISAHNLFLSPWCIMIINEWSSCIAQYLYCICDRKAISWDNLSLTTCLATQYILCNLPSDSVSETRVSMEQLQIILNRFDKVWFSAHWNALVWTCLWTIWQESTWCIRYCFKSCMLN